MATYLLVFYGRVLEKERKEIEQNWKVPTFVRLASLGCGEREFEMGGGWLEEAIEVGGGVYFGFEATLSKRHISQSEDEDLFVFFRGSCFELFHLSV